MYKFSFHEHGIDQTELIAVQIGVGPVPPRSDIPSQMRTHPFRLYQKENQEASPQNFGDAPRWLLYIGRHLSTKLLLKNDARKFSIQIRDLQRVIPILSHNNVST